MNRRIENTPESFHTRLEKAARHVVGEAAELKGGYLISPEGMALLQAVLADKPQETEREGELREKENAGSTRIFDILTRWLRARRTGKIVAVNVGERIQIQLLAYNELPGIFSGGSIRDAYAQAAQVVLHEEQ